MTLLVVFIALAFGGEAINVMACLALERFQVAPSIVIPFFFVTSVVVLWLAWRLAIRLTEPRPQSASSAGPEHLVLVLSAAIHAPMIP